ncbi:MAG TPA: CheR family methyltransferase [Candidatus Nanoarchaeia archaeon]|nr:CheR family methyltransferase [Candidatus Nanoarchaeia archaeon]
MVRPINIEVVKRLEAIPRVEYSLGRPATTNAFYRYPNEYEKIEEHMAHYLMEGGENYSVLCVGSSSGKEPISVAISWLEVKKRVCPSSTANIDILAVDLSAAVKGAFQENRFPVYQKRDQEVARIRQYALRTEEPKLDPNKPSFVQPSFFVAFPDSLREGIHYVVMDAEANETIELPKVLGISGFDALVCHTTSRYFKRPKESMSRLKSLVKAGGIVSHLD